MEWNQLVKLTTSIGTDGKEYPRQTTRKPVAVFNPKSQEEKALQNPAILEKLSDGIARSCKLVDSHYAIRD